MKIFFIDANNTTPQVNYPLLETLSQNYSDLDITYFSSDYSEHTHYYDENYKFKKKYIYSELVNKINSTPIRRFFKIFSYSFSTKLLFLKALKEKPDIVHINWFVNPFFDYQLLKLLKKNGAKIVITQHNYFQHGKKSLRPYETKIFDIADRIICLSQYIKSRFNDKYKEKIIVIEHGNTYEKDIKINKTKKIPNNKIKIIFIGGIFPYKGIEILIQAISNINNDDILLYILGKGNKDYIESLKRKLILHNLSDKTFFEKEYIPYSTLLDAISNASFGVLPYIEATQSGVPFLFYNLHKPIILTNVGGLAENTDERFTKVINPNIKELKKAIIDMINDIKSNKIKDEYFTEFLNKNKWENTLDKYYELYKSLL